MIPKYFEKYPAFKHIWYYMLKRYEINLQDLYSLCLAYPNFYREMYWMIGEKICIYDKRNQKVCRICFKRFQFVGELNTHKRVQHSFNMTKELSLLTFYENFQVRTSEGKLMCSFCGKNKFQTKRRLISHMKNYHEKMTCEYCYKDGFGWDWLIEHQNNAHPARFYDAPKQRQMYKCNLCTELFKYKTAQTKLKYFKKNPK